MMPARMPFWMFGAKASVATNVAVPAMPSSWLASHACFERPQVDQVDHGEHDHRGEDGLRQVVEAAA